MARDFFQKKRASFGLEITDTAIKIAFLKKRGDHILIKDIVQIKIQPNIVQKGEIQDTEKLSFAIKDALNKTRPRIKTPFVITCIPEANTLVGNIVMPHMTDEELDEGVIWEIEQHIPLSLEEVYTDWQKTDLASSTISILFGASKKEIVDSYVTLMKKSELDPIAIDIEAAATLRSLFIPSVIEDQSLIVDIGAKRTCFIIANNKSILFNTSIPISGDMFTESIAKNQYISFQEAEYIKMRFKGGLTEKVCNGVLANIRTPLDILARKIGSTMSYFEEHFEHQGKIKNIILCGGSSRLSGISEYLALKLRKQVVLGNPATHIDPKSMKKKGLIPYDLLGFEKVIGLALRGILYDDLD